MSTQLRINQKGNLVNDFKSGEYWEARYKQGGNSGAGSYGKLAQFKADVINNFVSEHKIRTVTELGVGDGNQLSLGKYDSYTGLDVSKSAVKLCKKKFAGDRSRTFAVIKPGAPKKKWRSSLTLSLDVIYHLIEDEVFERYMSDLFWLSKNYVIIYSSNNDLPDPAEHIKNRKFTEWVKNKHKDWGLIEKIENNYPLSNTQKNSKEKSRSSFFIYEKLQA